ncbi:PqqD family protein [Thomasclavelia saccharogumia]|uniref:PqqD family protein n=1 Tax=Thomasclavelia saccharogumia TaxID=341225 RepID=UPI00047BBF56|nr:PqqD family protein [Thomasclavelia saccharogumia]
MKIKPGFIIRKLADNYVVVSVNNQNEFQGMIQLNQTGAFIWQQLEAGKNEDEILSLMLEKYEISEEKAKEDITLFIEKLRKDNLIDE